MTAYTVYFAGLSEYYHISEGYRRWTPEYCQTNGYGITHDYTKYAKHAGKTFNLYRKMSDKIKESVNDTFVFINTVSQERDFDNFLDKYELKDLIVYQMPYYVTNHNNNEGRNLRVTVLASKEHFWRDWYSDDTESLNEIEEEEDVPPQIEVQQDWTLLDEYTSLPKEELETV